MDMKKILDYAENIAENLEGLVSLIECDSEPLKGAIFVNDSREVSCISKNRALEITDGFGKYRESVMIGSTDYILIYDSREKIAVGGEAYIPSGYVVMKSCYGLMELDEDDIVAVTEALSYRVKMIALGKYRLQAYPLD